MPTQATSSTLDALVTRRRALTATRRALGLGERGAQPNAQHGPPATAPSLKPAEAQASAPSGVAPAPVEGQQATREQLLEAATGMLNNVKQLRAQKALRRTALVPEHGSKDDFRRSARRIFRLFFPWRVE